MTREIGDAEELKKIISDFSYYNVPFHVMPQMDESRPWFVEIDVPTWDGTKTASFSGATLEIAMKVAIMQYMRRRSAREAAWGVLQ